MISKELFQKIRRIEITTSRLVNDVFAGQYHSVFKGQGIEFDEVREYQFGDDIRSIDWNVTARTGVPHVKKFIEERELTVMLLVDVSMSCRFGTVNQLKSKLAAELAAIIAFCAIRNNDKVGLIIFSDQIEKFIAPRKGAQNVLRLIREVLFFQPQRKGTDIGLALDYLNRIMTRKTVAFLISDFFDPLGKADEPALKKILRVSGKRHDCIAVTLNDPREMDWPAMGLVTLEDAETGTMTTVDTSSADWRRHYTTQAQQRLAARQKFFQSAGLDQVDVSTAGGHVDELVKFFLKRRKRKI